MQVSPVELIWGVITIVGVLFFLTAVVLVAAAIHSRKIRESEYRFRLLFDSVFDSIVLLDESNRIVDVNESCCSLLGFTKKELRQWSFGKLVPREKWPKLQAEFSKTLLSGLDYLGETELVAKKGNVIPSEVGGTSLKLDGYVYLLASFRDVGARRQAEKALMEKNAALNEILAHLEQEKLKIREDVAETIDRVLMPDLNKLIGPDGSVVKIHYETLRTNLRELAMEAGGMLHVFGKLTPREIEICNLIKSGVTSKDIGKALNISELTVNKHRERIRKKLVIAKKDINLATYLKKK